MYYFPKQSNTLPLEDICSQYPVTLVIYLKGFLKQTKSTQQLWAVTTLIKSAPHVVKKWKARSKGRVLMYQQLLLIS